MDDYSGKRAGDGSLVSRKGSAHVLRDTANNRDQKAQFCNRIGCSGRPNSSKGGKETIGSSSRTCSVITKPRNSLQVPRKKFSSQLEADSSETGSVQDEPEGIPLSGRIKLDSFPI
ncbi:E3 UBIQUITIN-PROTEIN LIGASE ATL44-RELATED [Salix koriyanagi]|uniref:E3 UBIQUITIN-PROTEIN LIGASE ATL44-RELATED n=1 Tax=Salix koriyanagi TaxID=2511006 RepID=A0A9Q0ZSN8_9ROSI|nr:E3 UBIQUITIN-PROTEIN LIGASE ATL44-RELATED [Salix koriyanagi]